MARYSPVEMRNRLDWVSLTEEQKWEEADLMKADLYRIGKALDIPALPYSGHEAVTRDFLPRIQALKDRALYEIEICNQCSMPRRVLQPRKDKL